MTRTALKLDRVNYVPRSPLKYQGSKQAVAPQILHYFPAGPIKHYIEPFVGGLGMLLAVMRSGRKVEHYFASDANAELINTYWMLATKTALVIAELKRLEGAYNALDEPGQERFYYSMRDSVTLASTQAAARMIFLNKTGFNGMYRVNKAGEFNIPHGKPSNRQLTKTICDVENLTAVAEALKRVALSTGDFNSALVNNAQPGDVVYFDSPYYPTSDTASFTAYTKEGFTEKDQERLAVLFERVAHRGVHVYLSNSDTPWVRDRYRAFRQVAIYANRSSSAQVSGRGITQELLVIG